MNNQKIQPLSVGASSLLVIFAVLCLTVFALLGLGTVQADQRLSEASASAAEAFYEADLQAETILAQLRNGKVPEGVTEENGVYSYSCPVMDTQALQVKVRVDGKDWQILSWKTASVAEWKQEDSVSVWDGN